VLINLRHGIRQSTRLAEQLTGDAIVGCEAQGLLGRLHAIRAELDALAFAGTDPRWAENDPFWNEPPHPFQQRFSS
jgi:hypothetical protein